MTNGDGSPANIRVFFNMIPDNMMAAMPTKYALGATQLAPWNSAPAISAIIGSLALHGMKVVVMIVIRRSFSLSIVRLAMMPGTPQPVPISIGIKDLPDNPNLRKIRSMIKAIRAIQPQSSRIARNRKSTSICGTKPRTAPIPAMIPSTSRETSQPAVPMPSRKEVTAGGMISPNSTSFVQSVTYVPTVVTDTQYTRYITTAKIGNASQRLVTKRSIRSDTFIPLCFFTQVCFISLAMYSQRSLVIMLSASSSQLSSSSLRKAFTMLLSVLFSGADVIIFSSFSRYFTAYQKLLAPFACTALRSAIFSRQSFSSPS